MAFNVQRPTVAQPAPLPSVEGVRDMRFDTRYSGGTMESSVPRENLGGLIVGPQLTPEMFGKGRGSQMIDRSKVWRGEMGGPSGSKSGKTKDYEDIRVPVYNAGMNLVPGQTSSEFQVLRRYNDGTVLNLTGNRYNPSQFFGGMGGSGSASQREDTRTAAAGAKAATEEDYVTRKRREASEGATEAAFVGENAPLRRGY